MTTNCQPDAERNARIAEKVMGHTVRYVAAEKFVLEKNEASPIGVVCNFGGAVFTADRDWLVDGYLDETTGREVASYDTDIASAWEIVEWMHLQADGKVRQRFESWMEWMWCAPAAEVACYICEAAEKAVEEQPDG